MDKQDSKNMFLRNFDFMVNPYTQNSCLGISLNYLTSKCPDRILYSIYRIWVGRLIEQGRAGANSNRGAYQNL